MSFLHYLLAILFGFCSIDSDKNPSQKKSAHQNSNPVQVQQGNNGSVQRKSGGPDKASSTKYGPIIIIEDTHYKLGGE